MIRKQLAAMAALLPLAFAGAARGADDPGKWYAGVDYGKSHLDRDDSNPGLVDRDDKSDVIAIRVGYRFVPAFAVEAGYVDIGDFSASYVPPCPPSPTCQPYDSKTSIDGFLLNAVGIWPIAEHFELKCVIGATYRKLDATVNYATATNHWSETDTIFSFGVGIGIPVNERLEIDLDYTHYRELGLGMTLNQSLGVIDEAESSLTTLGVRFRF
jgi:opacity protein-like surface antigen